MGTVSKRFTQGADAVYAALTDPDHLKRRAEAAGHRNVQVTVDAKDDGCSLVIERDIESEIPAIAKKFVDPVNHVVSKFTWKKSGDSYTGSYDSKVNDRISVSAKLTIRPAGEGSEYSEDNTAKVNVPLVGRKIAGLVENETAKSVKPDLEWTATDLD